MKTSVYTGECPVGARVVRRGGVGLAPFVLPECEALAALAALAGRIRASRDGQEPALAGRIRAGGRPCCSFPLKDAAPV
jgi:hypothetical protein